MDQSHTPEQSSRGMDDSSPRTVGGIELADRETIADLQNSRPLSVDYRRHIRRPPGVCAQSAGMGSVRGDVA